MSLNEHKIKGVYFRTDLINTTKNGACVINLDERKSIESYRIVSYINSNDAKYFDSL